jgi:general secretion pathway protein E
MSDLFKAEAKRLADYLSRVHGVKLKHASLLEAVAHLHGRADWNTLLAAGPVAPAMPTQEACSASSGAGVGLGEKFQRDLARAMPASLRPLDLDKLGLGHEQLAAWRQCLAAPGGLFIVAGPTGSGLSTTVTASARTLAATRSILVVDDDIVVNDIPSASCKPYMLGTYDVVVCHIRDAESAKLAVRAAFSGALVIASLHATSATGVLRRLRDVGVSEVQTDQVVRGILVQNLLRHTCTSCGGAGCADCLQSGYGGRTAVSHVLATSPGQRMSELLPEWPNNGTALVDDAISLVERGVVNAAEALRVYGELAAERLR